MHMSKIIIWMKRKRLALSAANLSGKLFISLFQISMHNTLQVIACVLYDKKVELIFIRQISDDIVVETL